MQVKCPYMNITHLFQGYVFPSFYETYLFDPHILGIFSLFILLFINNDVATRNIYMYVTIYNISLCDTFGVNVYGLIFPLNQCFKVLYTQKQFYEFPSFQTFK